MLKTVTHKLSILTVLTARSDVLCVTGFDKIDGLAVKYAMHFCCNISASFHKLHKTILPTSHKLRTRYRV